MSKASVIISFYNRIDQLKLILTALNQQTFSDFEVIISDDGSNKEVVDEIQYIINQYSFDITHVWHPDNGFNKTKILNKSIIASKTDYLIFIDGDCIPANTFIDDHLKYSQDKRVLIGRRVELSLKLSEKITSEYIQSRKFKWLSSIALLDSFKGDTRKAEAGIRMSSKWINEKLGSYNKGILGCNFSIHKTLLLELNGFDERYIYPGVGEDTELRERVRHAGLEIFKPKFALVQYHLWHKKQSRSSQAENMKLLKETMENKYIKTPYGINKE